MSALLLLLPLLPGLLAMPFVRRAPIHGAFLASWAVFTLLGFAPAGLIAGAGLCSSSLAGLLVIGVSLGGFTAGFWMLARLSRLARGEELGSSRFLVGHHVAVVVAFFIAELFAGRGLYLSAFCLVACGVGALICAYDGSKLRSFGEIAEAKPVAF